MCSKLHIGMLLLLSLFISCSPYRRIEKIKAGDVALSLSVANEADFNDFKLTEPELERISGDCDDGPLIMNAIRDSETGEMVATDVITASRVIAKFRNVAERAGYVSIGFDLYVPAGMSYSEWQLKVFPFMKIQGDTIALDPVYVTGAKYRERQLRGYERYQRFLTSIITDSTDLLRMGQLEIFLQRHFPETYAMKNDTSFVSDSVAENLFGVTQKDAFEHYRRHVRWRINESRKRRTGSMYERFVKDPVMDTGVRLDTVLTDSDGDFIYRYTHTFRSRPGLRQVSVFLQGEMYEDGECFLKLPYPDELTYYISTLASLLDAAPRYRMVITQRRVFDETNAFIDFAHSSAQIDTSLGDNASELCRIRKCISDVVAREELALDSLVIVASCSPEGSWSLNKKLSCDRSEAVKTYIMKYVPESWRDSLKTSEMPENWDRLMRLVEHDEILSADVKKQILSKAGRVAHEPDAVEYEISQLPDYLYLREKIYPKLRTVRFDFHMHRIGMVQDTVFTTEIDSVYSAGVNAMKNLDYKKAVTLLRPYDDYNAALAFMCADYDYSAMDVLKRLDNGDPRVEYLLAMVMSRLELYDDAFRHFEKALQLDPSLEFRANLDPEMHMMVRMRQKDRL